MSIVGSVISVCFIWGRVEPNFGITYNDLISISLTAVTIILAATALIIGLVGFYSIRDIKADARNALNEQNKELEKDLSKIIDQKFELLEQELLGNIGGLNELNQSDEDR
ncbi:MAG: hypothetical protein OXH90_04380 [Paracoccaceae bacterium]|nr:hypothetical protein [Paracoccaceae bacterium]MDE2917807.1 hypothetical protein [Paracoccaceae bacterium]